MDTATTLNNSDIIINAYNAFNARDIDNAVLLMDTAVEWPKAWEGGHIVGHDEIREYWTRQWSEVNPVVNPIAFAERPNGSLEVSVHQNVKAPDGNTLFDGIVKHIYTFKNGLIKRMDIEV